MEESGQRKPNPMAKDLRQPKYKPKVIPNKKKPTVKTKHKEDYYDKT